MLDEHENWFKLQAAGITNEMVTQAYKAAIDSMIQLNVVAARLMHKYNAHAATDITGFGLLGHALNLARFQLNPMHFAINRLPIIQNIRNIAVALNQQKLLTGRAVETSGGLLILMDSSVVSRFCEEFKILNDGHEAWQIGEVQTLNESTSTGITNTVSISENVQFIHY